MTNSDVKQALAMVETMGQIRRGTFDIRQVPERISYSMKEIKKTQRKLQVRRAVDSNSLAKKSYEVIQSFGKNPIPEWDNLFRNQLTNVEGLNECLVGVICYSKAHLADAKEKFFEEVKTAKENRAKYNNSQEALTDSTDEFENSKFSSFVFDPTDPASYDVLEDAHKYKFRFYDHLRDVKLREVAHNHDLTRMNSLERYISFYYGLITSAEEFALNVKHTCDELDQLIIVAKGTLLTKDCMLRIHEGVGILRGYSNDLSNIFTKTNDAINTIGSGNQEDILSGDSGLDYMITQGKNRMTPNE